MTKTLNTIYTLGSLLMAATPLIALGAIYV